MNLLLSAALLAVSAAAAPLDKEALAEHIRESYNVPAVVDISFSTPVPAGVPGFSKLSVTFKRGEASQDDALYISEDGRHYLMGGFKDLSVSPDNDRVAKLDLKGSPARGPKGAAVTVVQYTDFECPFCQKGYEIMRDKVMKEKDFEGKVRWIYKSLPLTSIHPWAQPAAMAAECAKLQGEDKFWKVHDALFEKQREITPDNLDEKLAGFLKDAKGDQKALETCVEGKKTLAAVTRDSNEADSMGISGTPAFLVNGHIVSGADYGTIKRLIEESLKGKHGKG